MVKNNKGFSLVEFIVVIGIIAIVTSAAFYGFGYLSMADCKKCASRINSGLSTARSQTMKNVQPVHMFLYRYDGDYYIKYDENDTITKDTDAEKIGNGKVTVTVNAIGGTSSTILQDGSDPVKITISRKDGHYISGPQSITVSADGVTKEIYLVTDTGKHFVR